MRALLVAVALAAAPAAATPLATFPRDKIQGLAPLLVNGDMAEIEADPAGRPLQITLFAYAAAPPAVAHDVVAQPEKYPTFVRNLSKSEVTHNPDGTLDCRWQMDLPIGHFNGGMRMAVDADPQGPINIRSAGRDSFSRWEFLPADGGGTVVVYYMHYAAPTQNALLSKMLKQNPGNETGMGLAAGLVLSKSVAREATRRAAAAGTRIAPPKSTAPGFQFLLERGAVAIIRSTPNGSLLDVSVVKRIPAPLEKVLEVVRAPDTWPGFMPAVTACEVQSRTPDGLTYHMTIDGILVSVDTSYHMKYLGNAGVDSLGVDGDLKGSRLRWDLSAQQGETLAVYRANHKLGTGSFLLRAMIGFEPLFEHGANVGVGIIAVQSVAARATGVAPPPKN
jgi:ribosome-associated toxin RatA of RatAB toxin-antitoxin module